MTRHAPPPTSVASSEAQATEPVIHARGLRRTYGSGAQAFEAVRGLDLEIREGEVFGLLGTNGAGKTSTLDLLEGLAAPTEGQIRVLGHDPYQDRADTRPYMGIMLQSGGLPGDLTVSETLEMWRGTCSRPTTADVVLDQVNLTHRADVLVRSLSGGEARRVDLACALISRPRLLFLDEPTTGLDPENRRSTWELLAELKASGVTMVLTTHYLDEAEALADRIAIMHQGVIAQTGTLREIVDRHPATITFDHPGLPLPTLSGAAVDAAGPHVVVNTFDLQQHLHELLGWADLHDLRLGGLSAHAASLESVFLDIAGDTTPTTSPLDTPAGARS